MHSAHHVASKDVLHSVRRALQGRCFDCYGKGERKDIVGKMMRCPTCHGSGRFTAMTVCQVALGADVKVVEAIEALEALESEGVATRLLPHGKDGADLWRPTGAP